MTQFLRPIFEISNSGWTVNPSGSTWAAVDEAVADDSDYIQTSTSGHVVELALQTGGDPANNINHQYTFRVRKGAGSSLTVALYDGATLIATVTNTTTYAGFTDVTVTLTGGEADAIGNYGDLRLRLTNNANVNVRVAQAWFQCDDAGAPAAEQFMTPNRGYW